MAGEGPLLEAHEKLELMKLAAVEGANSILIADVSQEGVHPAVALAHAMKDGRRARRDQPPAARISLSAECRRIARALLPRAGRPITHPGPDPQRARSHRHRSLRPHHREISPSIPTSPEFWNPAPQSHAFTEIRQLAGKDFAILAGTEAQLWESLKAGANGAALAFASAAPYATIAIWEAFRTREEEAGIDWQGRIAHPSILVTDITESAGLKHAMDINGYYGGPPRLPFAPIDAQAKQEIEEAYRDLKG